MPARAPAPAPRGLLGGWGLLLAPGAGASSSHSALVEIDKAVAALGATVRRLDFPYRLAGRRAPDRMPVLLAAVVSAAQNLSSEAAIAPERIYLGGRSMGGRVCSVAVAEGLPAAGLVLVSYPLHPPGRPSELRTAHFGELGLPCLFVTGTRDAFATQAEMSRALTAIPGPVSVEWPEGGDHSLRGRDKQVAATVADWLVTSSRGR